MSWYLLPLNRSRYSQLSMIPTVGSETHVSAISSLPGSDSRHGKFMVHLNSKRPCRCNIAHSVIRTSRQNWNPNTDFPNLRVNPQPMNTLLSTVSKAAGEGEKAETTRLHKARKDYKPTWNRWWKDCRTKNYAIWKPPHIKQFAPQRFCSWTTHRCRWLGKRNIILQVSFREARSHREV